jgi:nucleoside-diphosphate-sugar epimerase
MTKGVAVVLGASGFIGTRLVRHLASTGVARVRAVDIAPPRERLDGVDYIIADVRNPIAEALGADVEVLYNLAAVHRTPGHPDHEYYDTNIGGALNATALAEARDIKTIVFTSSISVYGPCEESVTETSPLRPTSAYGRSKRLAELIHNRWLTHGDDRRLITVRPGVVFGPGENGNYTHLARALRIGLFAFPGRRDTVKSGGYVDELLRTLDFALGRPERDILFNFAYPDPKSVEDIVHIFARVTGRKVNPMTLPLTPILAAAGLFEVAGRLGLKTPIHRERVMKLVRSTRVHPGWLQASGYEFSTDLEAALRRWRDETKGRFD